MLERPVGLVVLVAGDVRLLVRGDDAAVALDQRLHVPAMSRAVGRGLDQRIAEAEADAEPLGLVEQRLRVGVRHRPLVPVVGLGDVVDEPPREERRQRQLGVHDQLDAVGVRVAQQHEQPLDHLGAGVRRRWMGPSCAAATVRMRVTVGHDTGHDDPRRSPAVTQRSPSGRAQLHQFDGAAVDQVDQTGAWCQQLPAGQRGTQQVTVDVVCARRQQTEPAAPHRQRPVPVRLPQRRRDDPRRRPADPSPARDHRGQPARWIVEQLGVVDRQQHPPAVRDRCLHAIERRLHIVGDVESPVDDCRTQPAGQRRPATGEHDRRAACGSAASHATHSTASAVLRPLRPARRPARARRRRPRAPAGCSRRTPMPIGSDSRPS